MISASILESLHRQSSRHRSRVESAQRCACFYCKRFFTAAEITEWVDSNEDTALCPLCGIDSVVPEIAGEQISQEILDAMYSYWFERSIHISTKSTAWTRFRLRAEPFLRRVSWVLRRGRSA